MDELARKALLPTSAWREPDAVVCRQHAEGSFARYKSCVGEEDEEAAWCVLSEATDMVAGELTALLAAPPDRSQAGKQRLAELSRASMKRWGYDYGDGHVVPIVERLADLVAGHQASSTQ